MSQMIEVIDGVEYIFLKKDFTPADKQTAEMVKIVYHDDKVIFAFPEK